MDFHLTEQQELLVSTAREFFQQNCPTTLVQELALDTNGFARDLWRQVAALGWPGLLLPADLGGSGGALLDAVLLIEEMGRACFPSPFVQSAVVATSLLLTAGSPSQQQQLLPTMARGEYVCTLALTEDSADFVPEAIALQGEPGGVINGSKLFVKDVHIADQIFVLLRGSGGFNLLSLPTRQPGITWSPLEIMSDEKLFEVVFDNVPVHSEDIVGVEGQGWQALAPILQVGALARCAEIVGCAQRILEICVDYAKVREQSGRPIGSFQAIQHHCADLLRHVEGARYMLYCAAWKRQEGIACEAEVAMAKAYASEACLKVARKGHQIMGAIGYCEEHPLHLYHKRIQAAGLDFGDAGLHFETVAQAIGLT
jgi:alkylation response protein AidB-like acyl-CoA dehydrogenase